MLYYNGRIAGDRYHVTAYADLDSNLDDKDPKLNANVSEPRKTRTLDLQNWRDVNLAKGYRIGFVSYNDYWEKSHPDTGFIGKVWHRIKTFWTLWREGAAWKALALTQEDPVTAGPCSTLSLRARPAGPARSPRKNSWTSPTSPC